MHVDFVCLSVYTCVLVCVCGWKINLIVLSVWGLSDYTALFTFTVLLIIFCDSPAINIVISNVFCVNHQKIWHNLRFSCVWVRALPWWTMGTEKDRQVQKSAVMMSGWTGNRCVTRRTGTESAEGRNEDVKERELYPPPLLVVQTERWERVRDSETKGGERNRMGHREKRDFGGKHPYERQREKHQACFLLDQPSHP